MPRTPDHLCEHAGRHDDVARPINHSVPNLRCLIQCYRETERSADCPRSAKPRVPTCMCLGGRVE